MTDMKGPADADIFALHKQWDEILCPICMDHPHNAVLVICSSHEKGCRTYICDTSYRHSNCLDRFKKLRNGTRRCPSGSSTSFVDFSGSGMLGQRSISSQSLEVNIDNARISILGTRDNDNSIEHSSFRVNMQATEASSSQNSHERQNADRIASEDFTESCMLTSDGVLKCPLCRGAVLGWVIAKDLRQYIDLKPRSCSRESCSYFGNYQELRRHARRVHPTSRPADVDPSRQNAWRRMEHQREYGDILSAIRSAMPDAIVLGDYVIENGDGASHDADSAVASYGDSPWWTTFFLFHMMSSSPFGSLNETRNSSRAWRRHRRLSSRHRYVWGENLLGLHEDNGHDDRSFESDGSPVPRRRRRLTRSRREELP